MTNFDGVTGGVGRQRIGLLGGSFNPAHDGHLYISREAMKRLRLDAVWWLVSPQNPLKTTGEMAPLAERAAHGAPADLVIWNDDPLELTSWAERVMINGDWVAMRSRQSRLYERYKNLDDEIPVGFR